MRGACADRCAGGCGFPPAPRGGGVGGAVHAGDLSILHATGLREATRSHFDAEARIERAASDAAAGGWLGRSLRALGAGGTAAGAGGGHVRAGIAARGGGRRWRPDLSELMLAPGNWLAPMLRARLEAGFGAHPVLGAPVASLLSLSSVLEERFWQADAGQVRAYAPAVPWPDTRLTQPLQTVAQASRPTWGCGSPRWITAAGTRM